VLLSKGGSAPNYFGIWIYDGQQSRTSVAFEWSCVMKLALFGSSHEEIEEIACDLIVRHGLYAYDEAIRLSEIAHLPHTMNRSNLYRQVANKIEISFEIANDLMREKLRQRMTAGPHLPDLVTRLNSQHLPRELRRASPRN
jgi:hypothetical protein